ncbi:2-isopropylmalate synthase, partial [Candidatus Microgenomates bacterium]|nr:2-isopropylmalate synthase [Candidatus Microgenomates bacterium]
ENGLALVTLDVASGTKTQPTARISLKIKGKEKTARASGNGPVDASFNAVNIIIGKKVKLEEYLVQAITGGSDDIGKVHIQLNYKNNIYFGFGADTDIVVASVKAYLDGLQKIV